MFGFKKKHRYIDVEFYEQGAVEPFAASQVPIAQLPDTFEIQTTLNIQGEEWSVAKSIPTTKEEFRQTGYLRVFLYKPRIEQVAVSELIYSLPTISDDIAAVEESPSLENVFVTREDDWRQQEFVSRDYMDDVAKELACIRQIYDKEREGIGFRTLHVRTAIPRPLDGVGLTLTELVTKLGAQQTYRGVAFDNCAAVIQNGFAFRSSQGYIVWGQRAKGDELAVVCIHLPRSLSVDIHAPALVDSLLDEFNLLFVDWVALTVIPRINRDED